MKFGRATIDGSPRILVSLGDGLRDLTALPGRSTTTDGIDVIDRPVSTEDIAALATASVVPEPDAWLPPIGHPPVATSSRR